MTNYIERKRRFDARKRNILAQVASKQISVDQGFGDLMAWANTNHTYGANCPVCEGLCCKTKNRKFNYSIEGR